MSYIDSISSIEDVAHGKPTPDVYLAAAQQLGVDAGRCLVLEDSDEELRAAHAAGMHSIDVWPYLSDRTAG